MCSRFPFLYIKKSASTLAILHHIDVDTITYKRKYTRKFLLGTSKMLSTSLYTFQVKNVSYILIEFLIYCYSIV